MGLYRELKEDAKFLFRKFREGFREAAGKRRLVRKLALEFHRATMTVAQKQAYREIKKTQEAYYNGKGFVFTFGGAFSAKDTAKALTVLDLELPSGQYQGFTSTGGTGMKVHRIMDKRWF